MIAALLIMPIFMLIFCKEMSSKLWAIAIFVLGFVALIMEGGK